MSIWVSNGAVVGRADGGRPVPVLVRVLSGVARQRIRAGVASARSAALTALLAATAALAFTAPAQADEPVSRSASHRVISTDAGITGIVDALGAADRLVAIDVTSTPPAGREALPRVGYHRALSTEGLLSLRPDLVLASEHAGPPSTLDALRRLGVTVTQVPAPLTVGGLAENIAVIGAALDRESAADTLRQQLARRAQSLTDRVDAGASALLVRENDGVIRVAGANTAGAALLSLIGADNQADFAGYRSYSVEALLAADPQILVIAASADDSASAWIERYPLLQHLQAVREGRVVAVSGSSLVGGLSLATLREAEALLDTLASAAVARR